jgi:hypothetical protein
MKETEKISLTFFNSEKQETEERVLKKRNKREPKQKKCERDEKSGRTKDRNICRQSDVADFSPERQKRIIMLMGKKASNYRTKVHRRHS